jgi:hypothetical protein
MVLLVTMTSSVINQAIWIIIAMILTIILLIKEVKEEIK